jgi:hypothetical protein
MEILVYGNKLKLENGNIYNYRKKSNNSKIIDWFQIKFSIEKGYLYCRMINNKIQRKFFFHRLIYLFYNPDFDIFNKKIYIDHIDIDKSNNSIDNLRILTNQQNCFNTNAKGCYFHKKSGKWVAKITINKKSIYLGRHKTEEEAHEAYLEAKKKYHKI